MAKFECLANRCKYNSGMELHKRTHAVIRDLTLCGKELDFMWYCSEYENPTESAVTCPKCKTELRRINE